MAELEAVGEPEASEPRGAAPVLVAGAPTGFGRDRGAWVECHLDPGLDGAVRSQAWSLEQQLEWSSRTRSLQPHQPQRPASQPGLFLQPRPLSPRPLRSLSPIVHSDLWP